MFKRLIITCINILFPPLAILLLTGPETDTLINAVLFLLGVIPSHVHGFYISCTYFHRKNKVKKGRYPGDWRQFIYSAKVQNGGASDREVRRLAKMEETKTGLARRVTGRGGGGGRASRKHQDERSVY